MSEEIKMLPIRQQQIVDKIKSEGFSTKDFFFEPSTNDWFSMYFKPNKVYSLKIVDKRFSYCPGLYGNMNSTGLVKNWLDNLKILENWLKCLKKNLSIGNPWQEIEDFKDEMKEMNFDSYEEMFNDEDKIKIEKRLETLLTHFVDVKIDITQIKIDVEHLKNMSHKVSKKDWILLLLGNITGWIFTGLIPSEHVQSIWSYVKALFSGFKLKFLS